MENEMTLVPCNIGPKGSGTFGKMKSYRNEKTYFFFSFVFFLKTQTPNGFL